MGWLYLAGDATASVRRAGGVLDAPNAVATDIHRKASLPGQTARVLGRDLGGSRYPGPSDATATVGGLPRNATAMPSAKEVPPLLRPPSCCTTQGWSYGLLYPPRLRTNGANRKH